MKTKTCTVQRYHVFGTHHHHVQVSYRGHVLQWRDQSSPGLSFCYADVPEYGDAVQRMLDLARRWGFTHARFTGDWQGRSVRKSLKLNKGV